MFIITLKYSWHNRIIIESPNKNFVIKYSLKENFFFNNV